MRLEDTSAAAQPGAALTGAAKSSALKLCPRKKSLRRQLQHSVGALGGMIGQALALRAQNDPAAMARYRELSAQQKPR